MRRLDRSQLSAVWAHRTHKIVFGVERTVLVTFNENLFRAQTKTLSREIRKRQRKLGELQNRLQGRRPGDRGKKPTVAGVRKKVKEILQSRHMADLFRTKITKNRQVFPACSLGIGSRPIKNYAPPCWARRFCSPIMARTGPTSRLCWATAPSIMWKGISA